MIQEIKRVQIEWIDSASGPGDWERWDKLEPLEPIKCKTVGYLIEDAEDYKIVASTISKDFVDGRIAIPAVCILKVKVLK